MDSKKKMTISWSGGKDSALALYYLQKEGLYEITDIHTVIEIPSHRVGLHGVRESLIDRQATQLNLPVRKIYLQQEANQSYEERMREMYREFKSDGITHIMFGDIFLEDLRIYRERLLEESGIIPVYPLWKKSTTQLVSDFIDAKFKTVICSVNEACYHAGILGSQIDKNFIHTVPNGVDPCGENGEFHSFVFEGPIFREPILYFPGNVTDQTYDFTIQSPHGIKRSKVTFYFQDLVDRTKS
jgi:uncharacterized protein (TIGR00290 family)